MLSPKRKQELQSRPRDPTKKVRKGVVIHVSENFGRILCSRSFSDRGAHIFFDRNTVVNGTPLFMSDYSLNTIVPIGVDVDFKLNYEFPSRWRQYGSCMGYYCEWLNFDPEKTPEIICTELLVKTHRQDDCVTATDKNGKIVFIHPHV
uniref:Uncharacterized protein n=1 Tax=Panagrolaimus sp. JU765 TaxID=591449 RepID=A0AC34RQH3_9BILA